MERSNDHASAKEKRLDKITRGIGFALWQIQELEGVTAEYFVLLAQAKKEMGLDAGYPGCRQLCLQYHQDLFSQGSYLEYDNFRFISEEKQIT